MLGKYKLNEIYNEDCYQALKNIPDKSVDLIYTDPPYEYNQKIYIKKNENLNFEGMIGRKQRQTQQIDNISNGFEYEKVLTEFVRIMKYIYIYIYMV